MAAPGLVLLLAQIAAVVGPILAVLVVWALRRGRRLAVAVAVAVALVWGLGVWAFLIEPATLVVRHVSVESATWGGPPLRIGVISDIHVSAPHVDVARVERLVRRMNAERPDVVVLLGDYAGGHEPAEVRAAVEQSEILDGVRAFGGLRSRFGVYGVLGNHDSWFDEAALAEAMTGAGIRVLENRAVQVERPEGGFWIGGVADMVSRRQVASVPRTVAAVPPGAPLIVITHWPDPFEDMPRSVALTLAGHTHCGQVNLPLVGRPVLPSRASYRWPCGLYDEGGRKLFVTGGVGVSIFPVRFRAPPEIVVLTLRAAPMAEPPPER